MTLFEFSVPIILAAAVGGGLVYLRWGERRLDRWFRRHHPAE
jgi:hypothetical protein